jgi:hypothetical protein
LTNIGKRSVEGYSAATGVDLQLTEARLLAGEKQIGPALAKAAAVAQQARARGLLAFELQAILVRATIGQIDPTAIANLIRRARDAKLALIARQAESISRR